MECLVLEAGGLFSRRDLLVEESRGITLSGWWDISLLRDGGTGGLKHSIP
jgi:hypothetical protein